MADSPTLTEEQARLLLEPNFGMLATNGADGTPQVTSVWVDWDGERAVVNTSRGRAKEQILSRDPRATLLVPDRENPYRWVSVSGKVELDETGADAHVNELSKKYLGVEEYPYRQPGEVRVIGRLSVERVNSYGF